MKSMMQKRQALLEQLLELSIAHGVDFNWTFRAREEKLRATSSRLDQIDIFGDPVRYLRVSYIGSPSGDIVPDSGATQFNFQAEVRDPIHEFRIVILYEYDDEDVYEESSQYQFDQLIESVVDPVGILTWFRENNAIEVEDGIAYLTKPKQVVVPALPYPLDGSGCDYAHYMEFMISIT